MMQIKYEFKCKASKVKHKMLKINQRFQYIKYALQVVYTYPTRREESPQGHADAVGSPGPCLRYRFWGQGSSHRPRCRKLLTRDGRAAPSWRGILQNLVKVPSNEVKIDWGVLGGLRVPGKGFRAFLTPFRYENRGCGDKEKGGWPLGGRRLVSFNVETGKPVLFVIGPIWSRTSCKLLIINTLACSTRRRPLVQVQHGPPYNIDSTENFSAVFFVGLEAGTSRPVDEKVPWMAPSEVPAGHGASNRDVCEWNGKSNMAHH